MELRAELRSCRGCSEGRGLRRPVPRSTHTRTAPPASRVCIDLSGPQPVRSGGVKWCNMIVGDEYS
ncbi:unnamed protein product, partial [Sphacelaria rigidula]